MLGSSLFYFNGSAQPIGKILSPGENDTVSNGELFVLLKLDSSLTILPNTIHFRLDEDEMSMLIDVSGDLVSIVITERLTPGEHHIEFVGKDHDGAFYRAKKTFIVLKNKEKNALEAKDTSVIKEKKPKISFAGNLRTESRVTDISGPGKELRQEPPSIHNVAFQGKVHGSGYDVPIAVFLTNQNKSYLPSRNRYSVGFRSKYLDMDLGDMYPDFDPLTMNGPQIRGIQAELKYRRFSLKMVHGNIDNPIEGNIEKYDPALGLPPSSLDKDSNYVVPGRYARRVTGGKMTFWSFDRKSNFYIDLVQATDIETSIKYGGNPEQNAVGGTGFQFTTRNDLLHFKTGIALSVTTHDISNGALSKSELEDYYKVDLKFNPLNYAWLIKINTTTTPISIQEGSSFAWFALARLKLKSQRVEARYEKVGFAYESFTNPYQLSDRRVISLSDRIIMWKKKVFLTLRGATYLNNLSESSSFTSQTHQVGGNFNVRPGQKLPVFYGSYRYYIRQTKDINQNENIRKYNLQTVNAGINYTLKSGEYNHTFDGSITTIKNDDQLTGQVLQNTNILNLSFTELFPFRLNTSLQYQMIAIKNVGALLNKQNIIGATITYATKTRNWEFYGRVNNSLVEATTFIPKSSRVRNSIGVKHRLFDGLKIEVETGMSNYSEPELASQNYDEFFAIARLNYKFRY